MRILGLTMILVAGCSSQHPRTLAAPAPESGQIAVVAEAAGTVGGVQPVAVAVTSGLPGGVRVDPRQVYAHSSSDGSGDRIVPLPPAEAARLAGGRSAPGVAKVVKSAGTGSVLGAAGGAIWGAIAGGGAGIGAAAGAASGAAVSLISTLIFGGGGEAPADVAGFTERSLPGSTLEQGMSESGYVYYPKGSYGSLEVLLSPPDGQADRRIVPLAPAS